MRSRCRAHRTAFNGDGTRLAVASVDGFTERALGTVTIVDVASGKVRQRLEGLETDVYDVAWSPDGRWLAAGTFLGEVRIFDADDGAARFLLSGHAATVAAIDWSPDSARLVSASYDGTTKVWEVTDLGGREVASLASIDGTDGVHGAAFSPDGDKVVTGDFEVEAATVWDLGRRGDAEWANVPGTPGRQPVAFAPDGRVLTGDGSGIAVWDATTGDRQQQLDGAGWAAEMIAASADGRWAAGALEVGQLAVWDMRSGELAFATEGGPIAAIAWHPRRALLAVSEPESNAVRLLRPDGSQDGIVRWEDRAMFTIDISGDGVLAAAGVPLGRPRPGSERVRLWDLADRTVVDTFPAGIGEVTFTADGTRLVTASGGVATLREVPGGAVLRRLEAHTADIYGTAVSPDGSRIATTGYDGTVRVWDADTGRQLLVLQADPSIVLDAAFSPDGARLASLGADGVARVWAVDLDDLVELARDEVTRTLTDGECRQYLHQESCDADGRRVSSIGGTITDGGRGGAPPGPVDQWVDTLARFASELRMDAFMLALDDLVEHPQLRRFAEEIVPGVRNALGR